MNERIRRLLAANFLLRSTGAAMGVVVALYLTRINAQVRPVTALEVSLIVVVSYTVVELTLSPFAGALSDRYGSRSLLLLGVMLAAAGVQLTAFTTATVVLLVTRLLVGLGDGLTTPLLLKQLTALTAGHDERRARVMTLFELTTLLSFALGSTLGGFALDRLGISVFSGLALLYLLTLPLLWSRQLYRHERLATGAEAIPWSRYLQLLRQPQLWRFAPAWLALNTVLGLWLSQSAFQLAGPLAPGQALVGRFNERQVSLIFAGYGIVILIGLLLWAWLLPGRRKTDVMLVALTGMVSASLAVLVLNRPELTSAQRPIVLAWLAVSVIVETGFTPAVLVFLGDVSDLRAWGRGALMGLYNVLLDAGQLLGAW
ncbi:MAG: MFS transporter, partial [Anaerolineae bacterium]|nr:MFS transporter [Anaerolineae bacterium]